MKRKKHFQNLVFQFMYKHQKINKKLVRLKNNVSELNWLLNNMDVFREKDEKNKKKLKKYKKALDFYTYYRL